MYGNLINSLNIPPYASNEVFAFLYFIGITGFVLMLAALAVMLCARAKSRRTPKISDSLFHLAARLTGGAYIGMALFDYGMPAGAKLFYVVFPAFIFFMPEVQSAARRLEGRAQR